MTLPEPLHPNNYDFVIRQIANGLATTTDLIQSLSTEIKDNSVDLATIKADLTHVTSDANSLSRLLKEGDGNPPVLARIAILENSSTKIDRFLEDIEEDMISMKKDLNLLSHRVEDLSDLKKSRTEDRKSKRQFIIAIVTSLIALISTILVAMLG